jgi:hypothetical protein
MSTSLRNIFDVRRLEKIIPLHYKVMLMLEVELAETFLLWTFIAKNVFTACSGTSYKIFPLTNLNKYLYSDKSEYKYK